MTKAKPPMAPAHAAPCSCPNWPLMAHAVAKAMATINKGTILLVAFIFIGYHLLFSFHPFQGKGHMLNSFVSLEVIRVRNMDQAIISLDHGRIGKRPCF